MADLTISSLRGGLNNTDPAVSLAPDQCTIAENVEFGTHTLGSRRLGCTPVTFPGSGSITWMFRHLPTLDEHDAQLWVLSVVGTTPTLRYKDTSWHTVVPDDAIEGSGLFPYQLSAVSLHGKLFIAYRSVGGINRLHVWDGTSLRRTGVAEPAAPTAANLGAAATYVGTRYFRVRYTVQSGGATLRRSEPSDVLTFAPSGAGTSARITKPATISEGETHWEVEGSTDNSLFYRIATVVVGTTTYDDSTDYVSGYANATGATLSEDVGDYDLLHSAKFVCADDDRLILGGSWDDANLASRVAWTPVLNDPGSGNDERSPIDTDNYKDLNNYEGGQLTALSRTVNGYLYAFKASHTYQLTRSGLRTRAYDDHALSKVRGAVDGSVIEGIDQLGRPCLYFVSPTAGPCRIGDGGVQSCGLDILATWRTININANIVARGLFYADEGHTQQAHWWIAVNGSGSANLRIMLQTSESRQAEDGIRRGWTTHTGYSSGALAVCMFAENIEDNASRSLCLRPFIGMTDGTIHRCDTGTTDSGQAYTARIVTAPLIPNGIMNRFGVGAATLVAAAASGVAVVVRAIRNFGIEEPIEQTISLTPVGAETPVIRDSDAFSCSELKTLEIEFTDETTPSGTWHLALFVLSSNDQEGPSQ